MNKPRAWSVVVLVALAAGSAAIGLYGGRSDGKTPARTPDAARDAWQRWLAESKEREDPGFEKLRRLAEERRALRSKKGTPSLLLEFDPNREALHDDCERGRCLDEAVSQLRGQTDYPGWVMALAKGLLEEAATEPGHSLSKELAKRTLSDVAPEVNPSKPPAHPDPLVQEIREERAAARAKERAEREHDARMYQDHLREMARVQLQTKGCRLMQYFRHVPLQTREYLVLALVGLHGDSPADVELGLAAATSEVNQLVRCAPSSTVLRGAVLQTRSGDSELFKVWNDASRAAQSLAAVVRYLRRTKALPENIEALLRSTAPLPAEPMIDEATFAYALQTSDYVAQTWRSPEENAQEREKHRLSDEQISAIRSECSLDAPRNERGRIAGPVVCRHPKGSGLPPAHQRRCQRLCSRWLKLQSRAKKVSEQIRALREAIEAPNAPDQPGVVFLDERQAAAYERAYLSPSSGPDR